MQPGGQASTASAIQASAATPKAVEVDLFRVDVPAPGLLRIEVHESRGIEPGLFMLGASRREPGRGGNEVLREVELVRPFYLATREVSNQQFRLFKTDRVLGLIGGHSLEAENHLVVQTSWEGAAAYCNWLSAKEKLPPAYFRRAEKLAAVDMKRLAVRFLFVVLLIAPVLASVDTPAQDPAGGEASE